jgi:signal transduction histidine kinase
MSAAALPAAPPTGAALILAAVALLVASALWLQLRRRSELVARACHEARGPLSAAHLALHGAVRRGELPPTRAAALQLELRRAALALDDLHAAGRGGAATVEPRDDVDLAALLRCVVATWDDVARARGSEVVLGSVPAATVVRGDQLRLAQALGNVLANAIEHGGGHVEVRAEAHGDAVRVAVADGGPGLPAPVADLVRRPRAGRGARGRGLAIAAGVVSAHGGLLAARGSSVAIDLPAARPAAPVGHRVGLARTRGADSTRSSGS